MVRRISMRLALPVLLAATLLPASGFAQSQDTQSVAEAARRARAQKKNSEKPTKVITDDTLEVKKGDVQSATAEQLRIPGTPATPAQPASNAPSSAAQGEKKASDDEQRAKDIAALKEQIKQAQSELALQQDTYFSNVNYARDTAGKAKLDELKQQVSDKQQELERLKARLTDLQAAQGGSEASPLKP